MEPFVGHPVYPFMLELTPWRLAHRQITAGFTSRQGGAGEAPYASFNCALHVGDRPETVRCNREALAQALGFPFEAWTSGEQTHGKTVAVVTEEDRGRGRLERETAFAATDGLATDVPGVLLTSFYADCVPLYFYDPQVQAVGLAHAGWKGTVAEIASEMVKTMGSAFGSKPGNIRCAIGPSIGDCCYEVDDYVMEHIRRLEQELPSAGEEAPALHSASPGGAGKRMLNLKEMNRRIMIKAGILPTHIECTNWCTSCNPDLFFSYRKENGVTGRMASWIGIKES